MVYVLAAIGALSGRASATEPGVRQAYISKRKTMNRLIKLVSDLRSGIDNVEKFFVAIFTLLTLLGAVAAFLSSSNPLAIFIKNNLVWLWLIALTTFAFVVLHRVSDLNKRFVSGFTVNINSDLAHIWEFQGPTPWSTTATGELIITGSHVGGITKVGRYWENYDFIFKAQIVNKCLGVIIRAENLNSYYMLQINKDAVVPHRRVMVRLNEPQTSTLENGHIQIEPGQYLPAWEIHEPISLNQPVEGWFNAKVTVKGDAVLLYINELLVFEQRGFLQIPAGKVGFRNDGKEKALTKDIRVVLHPNY